MPEATDEQAGLDRLNRAAFTTAVFGLFLPFVGLLCGFVGLVMAQTAIRRAAARGLHVDTNARTFSLVVITVWGVLWLLILVPALLRRT